MRFIITKDYEELSQMMSNLMLSHMHSNKKRSNIAITTGSTCIQGYRYLAKQVCDKPYFNHVHYYIFDEFWFDSEDKKSKIPVCKISLDAKYFKEANIPEERIHNLDEQNYVNTDEQIEKDGGFDLVIMGIGNNGHFCGNQPDTFASWNEGTRLVRTDATPYLKQYSRKLLKLDFQSEDESRIPEHYITMGPATIMKAKEIIFLLSGEEKAEIAKKAFLDPISLDFPVSIFQLHPHVTVLMDEASAKYIKK